MFYEMYSLYGLKIIIYSLQHIFGFEKFRPVWDNMEVQSNGNLTVARRSRSATTERASWLRSLINAWAARPLQKNLCGIINIGELGPFYRCLVRPSSQHITLVQMTTGTFTFTKLQLLIDPYVFQTLSSQCITQSSTTANFFTHVQLPNHMPGSFLSLASATPTLQLE
jgi:hypothetical protein